MKAVLVIDMPDDVSLDEWYAVEVVVDRLKATEEELMQGIPFDESKTFKFVPLRPLPRKAELENYSSGLIGMVDTAWMKGYNECLEYIVGETE